MGRKMIPGDRRIAVGKAGAVINVSRRVCAPRQRVLAAKMQRVALIVVEQKKARWRRSARTDQAANNATEAERQLVGLGEIDLRSILDARRTQRQLPAANSCALHIDREKHV
jgi:hypothetical protein